MWGMVLTRTEGCVDELEHNYHGLVKQMTSIYSWPVQLAKKIEKGESQFNALDLSMNFDSLG